MHGTFKITPGGPEESMARLEAIGRLMDGAFVAPAPTFASASMPSLASCRSLAT
jgi:hypothetical protein